MPTVDMSDCPCCGGGGCCCGLTQADTLTLTFTGGTGEGACLAGKSYTLTGSMMGPNSYQWYAPIGSPSCLGKPNFSVLGVSCGCVEGTMESTWTFYVSTTGNFLNELSAAHTTVCSPFSVRGTATSFYGPFGNPVAGTVDYEVTRS